MATAWKKHASLIVFGIVFIGSLFAISIAKEETAKLCTVIGIDLGTTYSRVGVYKNGHVEIIANDQGNRTTPSWVAFTDGEILIGEAAKNQADVNPERTIFNVKRLIGRKFEDEEVQRDMKLVPYRTVNKDGFPCLQEKIKDGETKVFRSEEIIAMVLTKMKENAQFYVGKKIKDAVITVPAYFSDAQRQAIKDAGTIAGLNVARIINEPTAAAIAYGLDKKGSEKKNILVFDLGGGTFDVSILTIDNGVFEVLATNGDTHLGGEDFDQRVMEYFIKLIKKKHNKDISNDNQALGKLRRECERAKRSLSSQDQVRVEIESLFDGVDFWELLTRECFEELNNDLFEKTMGPIKKVMEDAVLEKNQIDEIVLVGGSTRIPKVQQLLKDYFNGKEPNKGVNPDESVVYGAAVQGDILSGKGGDETWFDLILLPPCEKGRLSEEDINRMIREAEESAEEYDARNRLKTYVYNMRNQINDKDTFANKLESDEKEKIESATKEALEWLDDNQTAKKEDYEEKLKEVEAVCNPIMGSTHQKKNIITMSSRFFLFLKSFLAVV